MKFRHELKHEINLSDMITIRQRLRAAPHPDPLCNELYRKMKIQGLRAKTIVDYTREPFIFPAGNVHVTLDYDIRTALNCSGFLDPDCATLSVSDAIILEVKWDEFLPSIIRDLVQLDGRRTGAFSKYAACRIYG